MEVKENEKIVPSLPPLSFESLMSVEQNPHQIKKQNLYP